MRLTFTLGRSGPSPTATAALPVYVTRVMPDGKVVIDTLDANHRTAGVLGGLIQST